MSESPSDRGLLPVVDGKLWKLGPLPPKLGPLNDDRACVVCVWKELSGGLLLPSSAFTGWTASGSAGGECLLGTASTDASAPSFDPEQPMLRGLRNRLLGVAPTLVRRAQGPTAPRVQPA